MEFTKIINGDVGRVTMHGKFTFADHIEFKKILNIFDDTEIKSLEIELSKVEFVDSAALGLLLLIMDEAQKKNIKLTLIKPLGQVNKMFKISRFYDLFTVID